MSENINDKIVRPTHTKRGKFAPGNCANPHGRPPVPEIQELRNALKKVAEQTGVPFIELFVKMAYKHKEVAIALAKKLLPDRIQGEGFGNAGVYVYIVKDGKHAEGCDNNRIALHPASESTENKG